MKATFKPTALAAAVTAATVGYVGVSQAQELGAGGLGDMAIIPYYSVEGDFQTGIHIINTSDQTQVVKLRFRRASDSMDALDIDLVMSPQDVWTGSLSDDTGDLLLTTQDTTCTVPENSKGRAPGVFAFPDLYREGAEEGYVEVIAMGTPESQSGAGWGKGDDGEDTGIAEAAKHVDGVPRSCASVRQNFFSQNTDIVANVNPNTFGNIDYMTTTMPWWEDLTDIGDTDEVEGVQITYADSDNVLRVSYFLRDNASGLEFGNDAVHIADFLSMPAMTNQEFGLFSGDITGFDYPDLNGGVPTGSTPLNADVAGADRGKFEALRSILGVTSLLNDWSTASERNVSTDWVVTFPGQYTMLDYYLYTIGELGGEFDCGLSGLLNSTPECDYRDLPVKAIFDGENGGVWDREEAQVDPDDGELVVSPSVPGEILATLFEYEVNVVEWTDGNNEPVLDSNFTVEVDTSEFDQPFGWAALAVSSNNENGQAVCDWPNVPARDVDLDNVLVNGNDSAPGQTCTPVVDEDAIPMVGFVAWERSFPDSPDANYGRIIEHASILASS